MLNLNRMDGECDFDYFKRLVYGKLVDKSLSDADYSELSEKIFGRRYASDVARRMMYGMRFILNVMDRDSINRNCEDIMVETEHKIEELKRERKKVSDQRREYNKILASDSRWENLSSKLIECAKSVSDSIGLIYKSEDIEKTITDVSCTNSSEAVLVFSDWHYGMVTSNIFNSYDTEICMDRVKNIVKKTRERIRLHNCDTLHVVVLGDLIHGAIHVGSRVASEELVCEQLMHVSEILAQSLNELSSDVKTLNVYVTYGNHARTVQNKAESIHRDNIERTVPWWLKQRLKENSKVVIHDEFKNEFLLLNVCGKNICACHGDLDSVRTSPRLLTALFHKKYGIDLDFVLLGDKHHIESFNELGVTAEICGALCGADDYASDKRLFSDPSQLLLIINDRDGIDAEYRLTC